MVDTLTGADELFMFPLAVNGAVQDSHPHRPLSCLVSERQQLFCSRGVSLSEGGFEILSWRLTRAFQRTAHSLSSLWKSQDYDAFA
jgi:hypothetical protein